MDPSAHPRLLAACAAVLLLGVVGVLIALGGGTTSPRPAPTAKPKGVPLVSPRDRARQLALVHRRLVATRKQAMHERAVSQEGTVAERQPAAEVDVMEQAVRGFLPYYLNYEVGQLSPAVRSGLRATTTAAFAAELLRRAPVLPPGIAHRPAKARLASIEQVLPLELSPATRSGTVTGTLERAGVREAFAFTVSRAGARWLVSGVGG